MYIDEDNAAEVLANLQVAENRVVHHYPDTLGWSDYYKELFVNEVRYRISYIESTIRKLENTPTSFEELVGKTITSITRVVCVEGDALHFELAGETFDCVMYHEDVGNEWVGLEDVCGDLEDLLDTPVLYAREDTSSDTGGEFGEPELKWAFYNIGTIKGSVTLRWLGESNGYYGIDVDFKRIIDKNAYPYRNILEKVRAKKGE